MRVDTELILMILSGATMIIFTLAVVGAGVMAATIMR